ncbi:YycH family regulatory protein [Paenibacillus sp. NPDC058071]|uniref:YycH family regulatory protein n=1 Tax=Paenibacillus sp. NPDC058071 TaxID=3346326 RepID=UPI0036DD5686
MIEKAKTMLLVLLVSISLVQSYMLAYSMPGLGATVKTEQDIINAEPLGMPSDLDSVIAPEEMIIHFGSDKHTVLYPGTTFYDMILRGRIQGREFKGFQRNPVSVLNWDEVRRNDMGVELRFPNGLPIDLLKKLLKVQGDLLFLNEMIDRIWIFKTSDTEVVRTFFFTADGETVYESTQADLTVRDVQDYVGFGEYQTKYAVTSDGIYLPSKPIQSVESIYGYETYSPDLMQRNLFFDPATTKALKDRNGSQIFTDGKRGLQVEQNGMWIIYTDPAASQSVDNLLGENVFASVEYVNSHGGWDGSHLFVNTEYVGDGKAGRVVQFQQYLDHYPVIPAPHFQYGRIRLTMQQRFVTEYTRSLITLAKKADSREPRWLPGGDDLKAALDQYERRSEAVRVFPALQAEPQLEERKLKFSPVWVVQLADGTQDVLLHAYPRGYVPPKSDEDDEPDKESGGDHSSPPPANGSGNNGSGSNGDGGKETLDAGSADKSADAGKRTGIDTDADAGKDKSMDVGAVFNGTNLGPG